MEIVIVYGSPRKTASITYKIVAHFKQTLMKCGDVTFTEFFLPQDLPHFCTGCYNCFLKGEETCPHKDNVQPIVSAIREADGMVFASPVYALAESAGMKALLDHLSYLYMPHRPLEEMFSKTAFVISTTAGAGTKHCIKTMATSLKFWGVKRIYTYGKALAAAKWEDVKEPNKMVAQKSIEKQAKKFYAVTQRRYKLKPRLFTRLMFTLMKKMRTGAKDDSLDNQYWRNKGWTKKGNNPFQKSL